MAGPLGMHTCTPKMGTWIQQEPKDLLVFLVHKTQICCFNNAKLALGYSCSLNLPFVWTEVLFKLCG